MLLLLTLGVIGAVWGQETSNPILANQLNREGQETRFGEFNSLLWTAATTGTSSGSVNAMLTSLSPLAGGVALANLMLGELIFGGLGVGPLQHGPLRISHGFFSRTHGGTHPRILG